MQRIATPLGIGGFGVAIPSRSDIVGIAEGWAFPAQFSLPQRVSWSMIEFTMHHKLKH